MTRPTLRLTGTRHVHRQVIYPRDAAGPRSGEQKLGSVAETGVSAISIDGVHHAVPWKQHVRPAIFAIVRDVEYAVPNVIRARWPGVSPLPAPLSGP